MNKQEFLSQLRKGLQGLSQDDIEERLAFYSEMIDDRIEDGIPEESAVEAVGEVGEIVSQIIANTPIAKIAKQSLTPKRRLNGLEITLIVLGSPIWISLLVSAFAIILSLYISMWSVAVSLWSVFASLIGGAVGGVVAGLVFIFNHNAVSGLVVIGIGLICAGLSLFVFYLCKATTRGLLTFTKRLVLWTKNSLVKKEVMV